jgi:hypothetical protein
MGGLGLVWLFDGGSMICSLVGSGLDCLNC